MGILRAAADLLTDTQRGVDVDNNSWEVRRLGRDGYQVIKKDHEGNVVLQDVGGTWGWQNSYEKAGKGIPREAHHS